MEFVMSQRELHRMHVVRLTLEGRESVGGGAKFLGISASQMKRLRHKMRDQGVAGLSHGSQDKPPWNKTALEFPGTVYVIDSAVDDENGRPVSVTTRLN
jgi:hypothetical protein